MKYLIHMQNADNLWWSKTAAGWTPTDGTSVSPLISPSGTTVLAGSGKSILDLTGNTWTITATGQVFYLNKFFLLI
jgi:hypothetical protein